MYLVNRWPVDVFLVHGDRLRFGSVVGTWVVPVFHRLPCIAVCCLLPVGPAAASEPLPSISTAVTGDNGFLIHSVRSPYQAGTTKIRVLLPVPLDKQKKYPVLFVLPVEANDGNRYGDGLLAIKRSGLHNKYGLICAAPTFSHRPWYADHPTDKTIRQETYFLKIVVPFVESTYPAFGRPQGRLLVGFSKSGWGAFSLLLRHPDLFGRAAAWDAPLMKAKPNEFGMGPIFGTQGNFAKYQVTALLRQRVNLLCKANRLVLTGYGNFRRHHQQVHRLMKQLGIQCVYRDGPRRKHRWDSGWLPDTLSLLCRSADRKKPPLPGR